MLLSQFFIPTMKDIASDSFIESHKYLLRGGFVRQLISGIYVWLPLGVRVLNKIDRIIDEEMQKIGALKIIMPCIQPASLWQESQRYDSYGKEMLKIKDRHDKEMLFGPTHEEVASDIFRNNVFSYKSLPLLLYQIHWKFRDEIRPRFGVMRSREFYMKDGYSFDLSYEQSLETYKKVFLAYMNIFKRMNLKAIATSADSGSIGGSLNHEFHVAAHTGENLIYYDKRIDESINENNFDALSKYYTSTEEKHDVKKEKELGENLISCRGIEIGHIFYFDTKYSKTMNFTIQNKDGKNIHPHMGSYGIGVSRLVGAIVECFHDKNGIKWPDAVSPFKCIIVNLLQNKSIAQEIYQQLLSANIEVLYDDTDDTAGIKFHRAQLIGIPHIIVIGKITESENKIEIENRNSGEKTSINKNDIVKYLTTK